MKGLIEIQGVLCEMAEMHVCCLTCAAPLPDQVLIWPDTHPCDHETVLRHDLQLRTLKIYPFTVQASLKLQRDLRTFKIL